MVLAILKVKKNAELAVGEQRGNVIELDSESFLTADLTKIEANLL